MKTQKTEYTCDRCGSKKETEEYRGPNKWMTAEVKKADRSVHEFHLCSQCYRDFKQWAETPPLKRKMFSLGGLYR